MDKYEPPCGEKGFYVWRLVLYQFQEVLTGWNYKAQACAANILAKAYVAIELNKG